MDTFLALQRYSFTREAIQFAPEAPGVYGIFDKEDLIYVGGTDAAHSTIRQCLIGHHGGAYGACTVRANRYTWEITLSCTTRAEALLQSFWERHWSYPRCHTREAVARA